LKAEVSRFASESGTGDLRMKSSLSLNLRIVLIAAEN
jgi:hypothetical protein